MKRYVFADLQGGQRTCWQYVGRGSGWWHWLLECSQLFTWRTVSTAHAEDQSQKLALFLQASVFWFANLGCKSWCRETTLPLSAVVDQHWRGLSFVTKKFLISQDSCVPSRCPFIQKPFQIVDCKPCQKIKNGHSLRPPRLRRREGLERVKEERLMGDWISTECESHVHGLYAIRRITFTRRKFNIDQACTTKLYA